MDILIKNMEMPKGCNECFFKRSCAFFWGSDSWRQEERPEDCPLILVAEHGDLIDRDAVATAMRDYLLNHFGERLDEDLSNAIYALIAEAEVVLERTT